MTAINAIASGARGRMMTDTAAYDRDGVLVGFVNKAVVLPHLGVVVASRGAVASRRTLTEELEAFTTFDEIVARGADAITEAHAADAFWTEDETELDALVMGWSTARRRVELYSFSTVAHPGLAPFVFHSMAVSLAPLPDDQDLRRIGLKIGRTFDMSRPAEKLLDVMELQRGTPGPIGTRADAPTAYAIGGAAVLTEVAETGITQRVVRRWSDELGTRLDPTGREVKASSARPVLRIVA